MAAYVIAIPVCWLGPLIYRAYLFFTSYQYRDIDVCEGLNAWKTISLCLLGLVNASIWLSTPDFLRAIQTVLYTRSHKLYYDYLVLIIMYCFTSAQKCVAEKMMERTSR